MPSARPHTCARPGCRRLVTGHARCAEHRAEAVRGRDQRNGTAYQRGYDAAWRRLRDRFLASHPFCVGMVDDGQGGQRRCGEPATIADHKRSFRDRPDLRLDPTNLQPLCHHCSGVKTAASEGVFGRGPTNGRG